jgi:alpha/beta superfamily hydrolase
MLLFPSKESTFLFPGSAGDIEVCTAVPEKKLPNASVIICHPHPLYGGTMQNKVVSALARAFQNLGLRTVRFNFRGVGKSSGSHDEGRGEAADVIELAKWLQTLFPNNALWLAGFSFGGFVAASVAAQFPVAQLISVAPQASRFLSPVLPPITCPWLIIQGEKDEVVSPQELYAWIETLEHKPQLIRLPDAGHFFHGQLLKLRESIETALADTTSK